jgi:hypothetical protein
MQVLIDQSRRQADRRGEPARRQTPIGKNSQQQEPLRMRDGLQEFRPIVGLLFVQFRRRHGRCLDRVRPALFVQVATSSLRSSLTFGRVLFRSHEPFEHPSKLRILVSQPCRQQPFQSAVFVFEHGKIFDGNLLWRIHGLTS